MVQIWGERSNGVAANEFPASPIHPKKKFKKKRKESLSVGF